MIAKLNELYGENYGYCPISNRANGSAYSYLKQDDEIFAKNQSVVKINSCFSKIDTLLFFPKRSKMQKDIEQCYDVSSFDRIMAHSLFTDGWVANKLAKKYNKKFVVFVQNSDINYFFKKMFFLRKKAIRIMCNAQAIVFCSNVVKKQLFNRYVPKKYRDAFEEKTRIIPFGIEDVFIRNIFQGNRNIANKDIHIITVGTIDPNKNQISVARAIEELSKKGYHITYTLVGNVVDQSLLDQLQSYSFVRFLGRKSYEELIQLYRENDIFALTSIHETFGLVYAEAMSQGLPIIYSKGQGFDGQIPNGKVGYAVESENTCEIANAIEQIMQTYSEFSDNARFESKKFEWTAVAEKYYQVIGE